MIELDFTPLLSINRIAKFIYKIGSNWRGNFGRKITIILWIPVVAVVLFVPFAILATITSSLHDAKLDDSIAGSYFGAVAILGVLPYPLSMLHIVSKFRQFISINALESTNDGIETKLWLAEDDRVYTFEHLRQSIANGSGTGANLRRSILSMRLGQVTPQIVIDATEDDTRFGSLAINYKTNQLLHLEGDFGAYFRVFSPVNYRVEALSILTPDVMQTLIEYGRGFDIEIGSGLIVVSCLEYIGYDSEKLSAMLEAMSKVADEVMHRMKSWQSSDQPTKDMMLKVAKSSYGVQLIGGRLPILANWTLGFRRNFIRFIGGVIFIPTGIAIAVALWAQGQEVFGAVCFLSCTATGVFYYFVTKPLVNHGPENT